MFLINLLVSAGRAYSEWRHRQRDYAELMALDDRTLADIGIRRSQIRGLVEGEPTRDLSPQPAAVPKGTGFAAHWPA